MSPRRPLWQTAQRIGRFSVRRAAPPPLQQWFAELFVRMNSHTPRRPFARRPPRAGLLVVALGCLLGLAADAGAQRALRSMSQSFGDGPERVDLLADRAVYDFDGHWADFSGNVVIRFGGQELRAERVRFNTQTHDAEAFGRVTLVREDGSVWSGDRLALNLRERAGAASDLRVFYHPFFVEAGKADVRADLYVAESVAFSTCTNAPGHRHYEIDARRLRLRPERDMSAHHAVLRLFGVPLLYMPYYWKDLRSNYGLRFEPGYRSRWGAYLLTTYKARLHQGEDGRRVDSRTSFDLRSSRGIGLGQRFEWYLEEAGDGWFSIYGVDDRKRPLPYGVEDTDRYRIRLNHTLDLSARDRVRAQALYVSDDQFMRDFFEREHHAMRQPDSYLSYTHTERNYAYGLIGRLRLNDFYDQVERLPEAWLNLNAREVGSTGLYYESRHAASFLRRQFDERRDPLPEPYEAGRVDSWHRVSYPLRVAGFLNVVPRAIYRGTYYTASRSEQVEEATVERTETDETGVERTVAETVERRTFHDAGAVFRSAPEFGSEFSFKAYGLWTAEDGTRWRHVVEPYANYTYRPEPSVPPAELYQFDTVDAIDFAHVVRLGTRQRWQFRRETRSRQVAMVDLYGDLLLEPEDDQDALDRIVLDSRFDPIRWMRWDVSGEYSLQDSQIDNAATRLLLWHDRFASSFEYRYRVDRNSLVLGSLTWRATEEWDVNLFGRYEFETAQVEEIGGYLQRRFDCIAFRLNASVIPAYERADGSREKDDIRVSIVGWLTHFPPDSILESDLR